jgi:hypothetical protein
MVSLSDGMWPVMDAGRCLLSPARLVEGFAGLLFSPTDCDRSGMRISPDRAMFAPTVRGVLDMMRGMTILGLCVALCAAMAGCADSLAVREDQDVQSSLQYDAVPCASLVAQRNDLMRRYNLPKDATPTFSNTPFGLGPVLPDIRSKHRREVAHASGEIEAMSNSITRRQCEQPAKGKPKKT